MVTDFQCRDLYREEDNKGARGLEGYPPMMPLTHSK